MNSLKVFGKYLDQPKFVEKFSHYVPAALVIGSGAFGIDHIRKTPDEEKKKETIKTISVLTTTVISALLAPKLTAKIIKPHCCHHHHHHHGADELIDNFILKNPDSNVSSLLTKAKTETLSFNNIKTLFEELLEKTTGEEQKANKEFLDKFIPNPEDIGSKHIFEEDVKRLSVLGTFPVLGGIAGGILGDKLTEKDWKERIPNKIKEGSYQYFANIFLCNIGAGAALLFLEQIKCKNKPARVIGMIGGIILAGVVFGSAVANIIGKSCIDPLFNHRDKNKVHKHIDLYSERTPEAIDIGLHVDDIATVAVLSGLKWIEPALPILYSVSGYRAGIGYRNGGIEVSSN